MSLDASIVHSFRRGLALHRRPPLSKGDRRSSEKGPDAEEARTQATGGETSECPAWSPARTILCRRLRCGVAAAPPRLTVDSGRQIFNREELIWISDLISADHALTIHGAAAPLDLGIAIKCSLAQWAHFQAELVAHCVIEHVQWV